MRLGYSEFSFGYAFTENLIRSASVATGGAPYFPNLYDEGRLGYDVRIDFPSCPLFLQYKLPERMIRDTADEISNRSLAGIVTPFFRMYLMRRSVSRQHELLIDLEHDHPDSVYYATPEMNSLSLFNAAYNSADVHLQSVLFSPREIGHLPDDKQHIVAYREDLPWAWFCSKPREVRAFRFEDVVERVRKSFEESRYQTVDDMARTTLEDVLQLVPRQLRDSELGIRQRIRERRASLMDRPGLDEETTGVVEDLLVSRELSRIGLGAEFLIAQPSA